MATDPNCIFCKIVAGQIPSFKLHEDAHTLAFLDINPANPGHALVIPKNHAPNLIASDDADLGRLDQPDAALIGAEEARQRSCRHPTGGSSADDDDVADLWIVLVGGQIGECAATGGG